MRTSRRYLELGFLIAIILTLVVFGGGTLLGLIWQNAGLVNFNRWLSSEHPFEATNERDSAEEFLERASKTGQYHSWVTPKSKEDISLIHLPKNRFITYAIQNLTIIRLLCKLENTHNVVKFSYENDILNGNLKNFHKLFSFIITLIIHGFPTLVIFKSFMDVSKIVLTKAFNKTIHLSPICS